MAIRFDRMIIPLHIDQHPKECRIELRGLYDGRLVAEVFHGILEPGVHNIPFDPQRLPTMLEAGIYTLRVTIDGETEFHPFQYWP